MRFNEVPEDVQQRMVEIRRELHRHPELAFEEVRTAERIMAELDGLAIPYSYGGKGSGVIAELAGPAGGPVIALRADMDALPGDENTDLP
jgi:hippurate hydrolase